MGEDEKMKRKEILPTWIRFFAWLHLLLFIAPLVFLVGLLDVGEMTFAFYGLEYKGPTPLHPIAVTVTLVASLSATVAYGILWGKDWAISLGIIYGWIALACCAAAVYLNYKVNFVHIPLEPLLLIPFIIVLRRRKMAWLNFDAEADSMIQAETPST